MKTLGWLLLTVVAFALTVVVSGWTSYQDVRKYAIWITKPVDPAAAEFGGVRLSVDAARARILNDQPDRAIVYVRMIMRGKADTLKTWVPCEMGLTDSGGRVWLPVSGLVDRSSTRILIDQGDEDVSCDKAAFRAEGDDQPATAMQAYLVPEDALKDLSLRVSSAATRPDAVSIPIKPVLRRGP